MQRLYDWNLQWKYELTFKQQRNDWRKFIYTSRKNGKMECLCFCIGVCMFDVTCVECLDRMFWGSLSPSLNGLRGVHLWVTYFQHQPPPTSLLLQSLSDGSNSESEPTLLSSNSTYVSYGLSLQCTLYTQSYGIISDWGSILEYKKNFFSCNIFPMYKKGVYLLSISLRLI